MSFLDHEIDMTSSGEELGGLFVNCFELIGHLEDLDCGVDAGDDRGKRIWCGDHHLGSMAEERALGLLGTKVGGGWSFALSESFQECRFSVLRANK